MEKKFLALGATVQLPGKLKPGLKWQFSFNNDTLSLYLPVILSIPIRIEGSNYMIEPYGGCGVVYNSNTTSFLPLIEGGLMIHKGYFFIDIPIYCYFSEYNDDFLIGLNVGWSNSI